MTLMKSLLLGSAASIVAVASAQAADLPTKKGAPAVEYVKICTINVSGKPIVGFTIPGSDTCMHFTGYITGQIEGGNLYTGYGFVGGYIPSTLPSGAIGGGNAETATGNFARNSFGYTTRLNFGADVVSNTSYGPLLGHLEIQIENGNGFDNTGNGAYVNLAYVTWAGITAGKAASFYSFTGGGPGWANFFSPDQQGFNQPDLLAYTATFGGGASATIAIQSAGSDCPSVASGAGNNANPGAGVGCSGGGADFSDLGADYIYGGQRAPDIVANLKITQGWGTAQVSGVAHNVRAIGYDGATNDRWGWGVDAGVSINIPQFGAGDDILVTGSYTQSAGWYSGLPDGMWGENGAVNGNGLQMANADTYYYGVGIWQTPTAWSVSAELDHHFTPQFSASLAGSVGGVEWSNSQAFSMVSNSTTWLIGGVAHYDPLGTNALDFEFELYYQAARTDQPNGWVASAAVPTFHGDADGFAARFEVTRNW